MSVSDNSTHSLVDCSRGLLLVPLLTTQNLQDNTVQWVCIVVYRYVLHDLPLTVYLFVIPQDISSSNLPITYP